MTTKYTVLEYVEYVREFVTKILIVTNTVKGADTIALYYVCLITDGLKRSWSLPND